MIKLNEKSVLKNGLRVLWLPSKDKDVSAIGFAVNAGSYFESTDEGGISHILEHLISRSNIGRKSLRQKVHERGSLFDAATSVSQTFFHLYSFYDDLEDLTGLLIKGIYELNINKESLEHAKESVLSEMAYSRSLSDYEILRSIIWKDERLTKPIMGSKAFLNSVNVETVRAFHSKFYTPENTSVVIISESIPRQLEELLEKIPEGKEIPGIKVNTSVKKPEYKIFQNGSLNSTLTIGFPTQGYKDLTEDRHIFNLGATMLKSFFNSNFGNLGLVYNIDWTWNVFPESGDFIIVIEDISEEHLIPVIEKYIGIMHEWPDIKLPDEEFAAIKKHRLLRLKLGESLMEALPLFTKNFSSSEGAHNYEEAFEVYEKATPSDTRAALMKVLLSRKPYTVVNLGINSGKYLGKLNQLLQDYYSENKNE